MRDDRQQLGVEERAAVLMAVPMHALVGPELRRIDKQGVEITFQTAKQHLRPDGVLHAGSLYLGLELANVIASLPHLAPTEFSGTVSTNYTLLAATQGEGRRITLHAHLVKRGKSIAFFEGKAVDEDGTVLAKSRTVKVISVMRPSKL